MLLFEAEVADNLLKLHLLKIKKSAVDSPYCF